MLDRVRRLLSLSLLANHFPELHGVRVLAVFSVLQWHVTSVLADNHLILTPEGMRFGMRSMTVFFGMDLFFVLSGFLIGWMLLYSAAEGAKKGLRGILRFYARRAFRTFPLYYVVLITLAAALPINGPQRRNLPWDFFYLTNYRPIVTSGTVVMVWGWSLCVEEHFYLLVPLLFALLVWIRSHRGRIALLVALWASALAIRLGVFFSRPVWTEPEHFQAFYIKTHARFDPLVAGILLGYLQFHYRDRVRALLTRPHARRLLGGIALACLGLLLFPHEVAGPGRFLLYRTFCWGTLTSLMYFAALLLLLNREGGIRRALGHPIFLAIATLGYGTYLVHIPVFQLAILPTMRALLIRGWDFRAAWLIGLGLIWIYSLLAAYLLHLLVEKPALALRNRWVP